MVSVLNWVRCTECTVHFEDGFTIEKVLRSWMPKRYYLFIILVVLQEMSDYIKA